MEIIFAVIELIQLPAIVLGLIALIGLLIQRRPGGEVINGTVKTVLGMLIIGVGIGALVNALDGIQAMFQTGIPEERFQTFVTFDEAVVSAVQEANVDDLGAAIAWTLLFGYIFHIILARITPFRYLYLTGHMIWIHAGAFAILYHSLGLSLVWVIALASITHGTYMTLAPAIAQPFMRRITGSDEIAFGHGQTLLNVFCALVGKLVGDPEHSAEKLEVRDSLNFFRDIAISTSLIFLVISLGAAGLAVWQTGIGGFEENISDGQNWLVFAILQGLGFVAGMLVLLQGVRMLLAEIVPAFRGIGEKVIPGARPALDVPVIFPYAPNSLIIGLISGTVAQVVAMVLLALIGWPVPLPSMIVAFFASGAGAIFGNATGGRRGAVAGGFLWGFVGWFMISFAYKMQVFGDLGALGAEGLAFTVPDAIVPAIIIWLIARLLGFV
ncbi:PTS ascorbate transporter subunit IIC [Rubrobacter taiwanensis]|jgi:PTS system ascorbate-specific IIC component|uniref:Ascorbate-specific PTS system EIIC component n=1 Tax=Rubrobacter taiwanensis TaxID=185139 RepID=A0A4R1BEQ7_9ACTN|nr:PTS ascorbate transporter subunit IIC [Rubrobacter taiwanensis]TCJ15611.1 PTS ascorbate transporter subunit IIC [Rubrobacter taiwanensis]